MFYRYNIIVGLKGVAISETRYPDHLIFLFQHVSISRVRGASVTKRLTR